MSLIPTDPTTAYYEALARQQQHTQTIGELQQAGIRLPKPAWLPTSQRLATETREALAAAVDSLSFPATDAFPLTLATLTS